ncbi:MAG: hypothetical protein LBT16_14255 [Treponema sp.]|nr:hypothetical protein [Treponema sp.]
MSVFCMLWVPLALFFWSSLDTGSSGGGGAGVLWALVFGTLSGLTHYLAGSFIKPLDFGLSRWFFSLVDIVLFPVVLPLLVFILFSLFHLFAGVESSKFVLFWLIPGNILRSIGWSAERDPVFLVLVPLLWTSLALGLVFLAGLFRKLYGWMKILSCCAIPFLLFLGASCFWAFYGQHYFWGWGLLILTAIPAFIRVGKVLYRGAD